MRDKLTANRHKRKSLLAIILIINFQLLIINCFSQDESSPIQHQKEKQSETRKIKTCTGTSYSYDKAGVVSKQGHRSSVESYDKKGDLIEIILYSPDGKISETTQCKYDSTGKLIEEKKIIPNLPTQKHIYYYKNGILDYGRVYMDTAVVHTCTYKYENKRLFEIITEHHILIEKNVPPLEAIIYKYDAKGDKIKEEDYEIELSPEKLGGDSGTEKANYRIKKLISHTNFVYDKDSYIVESLQYEGHECTGRSEFKYDAKGNMNEEIYYKSCSEKQNPEYAIKYEYTYY